MPSPNPDWRPETLVVHPYPTQPDAHHAVIPPIYLSTTFERDADGVPGTYMYGRASNPTRADLQAAMGSLEGTPSHHVLALASGIAATAAVVHAVGPNPHIVLPRDTYSGTRSMLRHMARDGFLELDEVDFDNLEALHQAVLPGRTKLVWIETPSNPLLKIYNIAAITKICRDAGALAAVDNTWATPLITRPFELGADFIIHAASKYLAGHSDVIAGIVLAAPHRPDLAEKLNAHAIDSGAIASPFDCYLTLRGIRTLAVRLKAACETASDVAHHLSLHPSVEAIHYPGHVMHPQFFLAQEQMRMPGAMLSFQLHASPEECRKLPSRCRLLHHATSLGGVESLLEHRRSVEGPESSTAHNLLRMSVGLEHADDLIADLDQALSTLKT